MKSNKKQYRFTLFLIGNSEKSKELIISLRNRLEDQLASSYELEVIDILENPDLTLQYNIMASPTLIKEIPLPQQRVVGSILSNNDILRALDKME